MDKTIRPSSCAFLSGLICLMLLLVSVDSSPKKSYNCAKSKKCSFVYFLWTIFDCALQHLFQYIPQSWWVCIYHNNLTGVMKCSVVKCLQNTLRSSHGSFVKAKGQIIITVQWSYNPDVHRCNQKSDLQCYHSQYPSFTVNSSKMNNRTVYSNS